MNVCCYMDIYILHIVLTYQVDPWAAADFRKCLEDPVWGNYFGKGVGALDYEDGLKV